MFKIALDAGHGKYTAGKRCLKSLDKNETREWFLNDRICDKVEKKLAMYSGYSLLRVDDTTGESDVSLENRVKKANNFGADFYLSVHHNAGVYGGRGGGIISIAHTNSSATSKKYQIIIYDELILKTGLKGNRAIPTPLQKLYVCGATTMPAVLVECGFMDSSTDVPIILTEEFAEKAADALTASLVKIGNLKPKTKELTTPNDIVWELSQRIEITNTKKAVEDLTKAMNENSSCYWMLRKIANKR